MHEITIPRLPDESARAYAARVEYVTAGPGRSLEKVRGQSGGKAGVPMRLATLEEWSSRYGWVESARQYDDQVAYLTIQEAAEQYRADLADYRKRYSDLGKGLYAAAAVLTRRVATEARTMGLGPGALALAANAAKTAADLEALALRVEHLLNNEQRSE